MKSIIFNHWDCESEYNRQIYYVLQNSIGTLLIVLCLVVAVYFYPGLSKAIFLLIWVLCMLLASVILKIPIISNLFWNAIAILQYIAKAIYVRMQRDPDKYDIFYEEKRKELSGYNMRKLHRLVKRKGKLNGTIYIKYPKVFLVCGFHVYKFNILALSPNNRNQKHLYFDVERGHFYMSENKTKWEVEITESALVDIDEENSI